MYTSGPAESEGIYTYPINDDAPGHPVNMHGSEDLNSQGIGRIEVVDMEEQRSPSISPQDRRNDDRPRIVAGRHLQGSHARIYRCSHRRHAP